MSEGYYRYDVRHARDGKKRCPVCWRIKRHPEEFMGARGGVIYVCTPCSKERYEYHAKWRARRARKGNHDHTEQSERTDDGPRAPRQDDANAERGLRPA